MNGSAAVLSLEPEDLDGHTVDELTDYLEAGLRPPDPAIDASPACRLALAALQRLRDLAGAFLEEERSAPSSGPDWIDAVLAAIPIDARAGRRYPMPVVHPGVVAHVTEGAIRGLIRSIGDEVPGLLVGAVRLGPDSPTSISIDVAVVHGALLPQAADAFRRALRFVLPDHVPFAVGRIDIHVIGLLPADARHDTGEAA